jgi:hypothetical protein
LENEKEGAMNITPDPYQDSIEKAKLLQQADDGHPVTLFRFGGYEVTFHSGYLVCGRDTPRKIVSISDEQEITTIAVWLDVLDKSVPIVHTRREGNTLFCDAVTYHPDLWEAQVESISRRGALIYDIANNTYFRGGDL